MYGPGGLVDNMFMVFITNAFTSSVLDIIDTKGLT